MALMSFFRQGVTVISIAGLVGTAYALPIYTQGPDPYASGAYTSADQLVNVESRNLKFDNGDWELGLGQTNTGGLTTEHFNWTNGATYQFEIKQVGGVTTFELGGEVLSRSDLGEVNDLFLEAKTTSGAGNVEIGNIAVNGYAWAGSLTADESGQHLDVLRIQDLNGDFQLSGDLKFSWTGTAPSRSRTEMVVKGFYDPVPEPTSMALMIGGLGLMGFFGFRRKKRK